VALPPAVGRTGETRLGRLTALVGAGYFFVWTVFGMAAFPLGVALAAVEMQLPGLARAAWCDYMGHQFPSAIVRWMIFE